MIEKRQGGGHDLSCDGCGVSEEVPGSWEELMAHMAAEGWKKRKLGNDWLHFDPACVADGKHLALRQAQGEG